MKTFQKIGFTLIAVLACVFMTSCNDDDDDDDDDSISVTINGEKLGLSYAFWYIDDESTTSSSDTQLMCVEFYSYNITKPSSFPGKLNFLSIDFEVPAGTNSLESAILQSRDYSLYVAQDVTMDDDGWQGETIYRDNSNSDCVITRNGNDYTITIANATVSDETTSKTLTLNFSGPVSKMPAEFQN